MADRKGRVEGKTVLLTGGAMGLGKASAKALLAEGATVIITDVDEAAGAATAGELGPNCSFLPQDVTDWDRWQAIIAEIESTAGRLDVLVNNAGVEAGAKTYSMIDEEDWDFVLDTNLKSVWRLSKMFTETVIKNKQPEGNIINVASISAFRTIKGQFPYAVSKAGLVKATEIMALEGARYGIRVNSLAPGYILTDVSRILLESERSDTFVKGIPMRRYGEFEDLDGPLLLLASDGSRYMTGSTIVVDGGHIVSEL